MITYNPPFTGRSIQHLTTKIKSKQFSVNINNFKEHYSINLLSLPEKILLFYNSISISNILKLKDIENNIYLIPYITESSIDITNLKHKFTDISIANWYTICNNINKS